jgi:hypothetical protein
VSLCIPSSSQSPDHDPHRTIYYLAYPLGRFAGLKHRQLARQVGVIITTGRIRRTLINKINLLVDYATRPGASACRAVRHAARRATRCRLLCLAQARHRLLHLRRASSCFGVSHGLSRDSSSTTSPRAGSSSTTTTTLRVQVPRHVARLVTRLVAQARRRLLRLRRVSGCLGTSCGSSRGSSSTTSTTPRVLVPRHVTRLVTRLVAPLVVDYSTSRRLVVDYCTYAVHPVASARRATCHMTHHRLLRLAQAHCRLLRLRRASGCLGTSRGSSRGSSSTTSTMPRVWVPHHVSRLITRLIAPLVVDYFDYAARSGASTHRATRRAARRRLLRLHRASGCLGMSRSSSSTTSPMPRVRLLRHVARLVM